MQHLESRALIPGINRAFNLLAPVAEFSSPHVPTPEKISAMTPTSLVLTERRR